MSNIDDFSCDSYKQFEKRVGSLASIWIFETITEAMCSHISSTRTKNSHYGPNDAVFIHTVNGREANYTASGSIAFNDDIYEFDFESGNHRGSVMLSWGEDDEGNGYSDEEDYDYYILEPLQPYSQYPRNGGDELKNHHTGTTRANLSVSYQLSKNMVNKHHQEEHAEIWLKQESESIKRWKMEALQLDAHIVGVIRS